MMIQLYTLPLCKHGTAALIDVIQKLGFKFNSAKTLSPNINALVKNVPLSLMPVYKALVSTFSWI